MICKKCKKDVTVKIEMLFEGQDLQGYDFVSYECPICSKMNRLEPMEILIVLGLDPAVFQC